MSRCAKKTAQLRGFFLICGFKRPLTSKGIQRLHWVFGRVTWGGNPTTGYRWRYTDAAFELPGFWLSEAEIDGLLVMDALLAMQGDHSLSSAVQSIRQRLAAMSGLTPSESHAIRQRVRHNRTGQRGDSSAVLPTVAQATLKRRQLSFSYISRNSSAETQRTASPQRLTHYRGNWYLTAWCHLRSDLRNFALDMVRDVTLLDVAAIEFSDEQIDRLMGTAFGIISAGEVQVAELKVSAAQARWVASERWHDNQEIRVLPDGSILLNVPYSHPHEILMEVLKHGGEVEVLAPVDLRDRVLTAARKLQATHGQSSQAR